MKNDYTVHSLQQLHRGLDAWQTRPNELTGAWIGMTRHPLTKAGVERLREELANLKKVERPRIIAAIAEARAHGDLRENAEYHAAKEQQGFIEGRIQHLEYTGCPMARSSTWPNSIRAARSYSAPR
jgi:hypothetical protein